MKAAKPDPKNKEQYAIVDRIEKPRREQTENKNAPRTGRKRALHMTGDGLFMKEFWKPGRTELEAVLLCGNFADRLTEDPAFLEKVLSLDPAVAAMEMPQHTPFHDYTVLMHTAHAVDAVSAEGLTQQEYRLLKTAAFFHDIGKPETVLYRTDADGFLRTGFPGHPEKSAEIAERLLPRFGYAGEELRLLLFYIRAHDMFLSFRRSTDPPLAKGRGIEIGRESVRKRVETYIKWSPEKGLGWHDFVVLCSLAAADMAAHAEVSYEPPRPEIGIDRAGKIIRHAPPGGFVELEDGTKVWEHVIDTAEAKVSRILEIRKICREFDNSERNSEIR